MSNTHQPGPPHAKAVTQVACAPELVQGKVDECTHKGDDFEHCHCICETCSQEDCICSTGDEGDDYWRRVDAEMDLIKDGF